jgi:hypothetical protein
MYAMWQMSVKGSRHSYVRHATNYRASAFQSNDEVNGYSGEHGAAQRHRVEHGVRSRVWTTFSSNLICVRLLGKRCRSLLGTHHGYSVQFASCNIKNYKWSFALRRRSGYCLYLPKLARILPSGGVKGPSYCCRHPRKITQWVCSICLVESHKRI